MYELQILIVIHTKCPYKEKNIYIYLLKPNYRYSIGMELPGYKEKQNVSYELFHIFINVHLILA